MFAFLYISSLGENSQASVLCLVFEDIFFLLYSTAGLSFHLKSTRRDFKNSVETLTCGPWILELRLSRAVSQWLSSVLQSAISSAMPSSWNPSNNSEHWHLGCQSGHIVMWCKAWSPTMISPGWHLSSASFIIKPGLQRKKASQKKKKRLLLQLWYFSEFCELFR